MFAATATPTLPLELLERVEAAPGPPKTFTVTRTATAIEALDVILEEDFYARLSPSVRRAMVDDLRALKRTR